MSHIRQKNPTSRSADLKKKKPAVEQNYAHAPEVLPMETAFLFIPS